MKDKINKNLVLGGSGLVGKGLCDHLRSIGEEVVNIDLLNGPEQDLRTMNLMPFKEVDYVWFLAWDVGGSKYLTAEKNLLNILRNNTLICEHVFHFLEQTKLPFLFTTTQLADPNNTYGITKILGEEWTKLLGGKMARFWNVYGWEVPGERSHVIPDLAVQAIENKHIKLITTGEEERQFIHIYDCARNMVAIRDSDKNDIDMTNGKWVKIKDLAATLAVKAGATWEPGEMIGYQKKIEPTKTLQSFTFKYDLENGLEEVLNHAVEYCRGDRQHL